MKQLHFLALFYLLALTAIPAAHAADKDDKETAYDRVLKTNILRCAYTSVDPHIRKDPNTGEISGPLHDIAEAMASAVNITVEWSDEVGHADFAEGLKTGRYDAYCGILAIAPQRARVAAFTDPILYIPYYAYTKNDETRFASPADLNKPDIRTGVIDGEIFQAMSRKYFPNAQEHSLPNMTPQGQLFMDLAQGKADVVIHDPLILQQYSLKNPDQIKRAFKTPLEVYPVGYAVSPDEGKLRDMLNTALLSLHRLGKIDEILNGYGIDDTLFYRVTLPYNLPE